MGFMRLILAMLAVTLSLASYAKDEKPDKLFFDSGAVRFKYSYDTSGKKLHGLTTEYYETGEKKAEIFYQEGEVIKETDFLKNGKLEYEMRVEDNKKYETRIEYYPSGELFRERHLVDGVFEGVEKEYYQNGKLKAERNYKNGKKEGVARGYHNNGNLQGDWEFKDGLPIKATIYYREGEIWLKHRFENGKLNGRTDEYDKEGNLIAERYYENDKLVKRIRR